MSDARDDYHAISHPGVNITAHAYIKELEEQNKEMLDLLILIRKSHQSTSKVSIQYIDNIIEKQTGSKIEEILK